MSKTKDHPHTIKRKYRPKPKEIAQAVIESGGLITVAARRLGVDRRLIYTTASKSKLVADAINESRERTTDLAESKLISQISEGNTTAIIFYLKTQAKNRGYVEQTQVQHSGSLTVEAVAKLSDDEVERLALERGLPDVD